MPYNTLAFNEFVDNVERTVLEQIKNLKPNMVRSLFTSVPWNEGDGEKVTFNSVCLSGFAQRVDENENYPIVNPRKGNELSKTQIQYGDRLDITRRMMKFNTRYAEAKMVTSAKRLVERMTNVLDNELTMQAFAEADQATFTPTGKPAFNIATSDAQPVASASHSYGGITFSNILANGPVLNKTNLTAAINQGIRNTPDDFGTYFAPNFDTVVIANDMDMIIKCHELFGSSLTPESGNNAVNFYGGQGSMKVVALKFGDRLPSGAIDTNNSNIYRWMLMDSTMCQESWQFMMAEEPTPETTFTDQDNLLAKVLVTQFASFAIVQPQGTMYSLSVVKPTLS
jgi:hypothetical protein